MMAEPTENVACFMLLYMLGMNNVEKTYLQLQAHGRACHQKTILYSDTSANK